MVRGLSGRLVAIALAAAAALVPDALFAEEPAESAPISVGKLLDLVVTATLREQSSLDAPASIHVITAAEIRSRGYRTIKAIMNDLPGFNDVSDVNEEIVAVRGIFTSTTNKILILLNGHRMNDVMLGRYNTDQFLGVEAIERVELIRGPASALYGTGALVGIVNIVTRRGADLSGTELKVQGGPHGQEAAASWGRLLGGYDLFFNFTYLDAVGQEIAQPAALDVVPEGQQPAPGKIYLGRYRQNLSGFLSVRSEAGALALRGSHFRRVPPRGSNGSFYVYEQEAFRPAYTENDLLVDYQYQLRFGGSRANKLTINPSIHYFSYFEQSFITFGSNRVPPLGERSGMQGEFNNYQLKLTYERQLLPDLHFIAGLDGLLASFYRSDSVTIQGDRVVLTPGGYAPGRWLLAGAFAQAVWSPREPLTITLGARFDTFQKEADPEITPRLGIVYRPFAELAVKILYGRSYLAPMWAHKRVDDGNFIGNPALEPESFEGYDLVVAYADGRLSGSVDLFYNRVDNLINGVPQPDNPNVRKYENEGNSVYLGGEITAEGQVTRRLRLLASYSHVQPATGQTSAQLRVGPFIKHIPHHSWRYGLRLDPLPRLSFLLWGRATSSTRTEDPVTGNPTIPAVALFDASINYVWRRLTLQLIGTNLTDRYYERGGFAGRPLARPGLSVEGAVSVRF